MKRGKFVIKMAHDEHTGKVLRWWWTYVAPNGETVCTSQMLKSEQACWKGIRSIKRGWFTRVVKP